ncbi:hypothetical protein R3X26_09100 [Vibrio sp. TH_r3]|uniref:hypothetical protein n=1 Tax=Vibrio sp. TH_r3 TaxID=3082084 RepID=UPI002953762B|nr:hypothetical protein [Vibrio sp. TH_r3]MDV7104557.1 hypothetical protein [Vibrio sp. TH_r3]
MKIATLVINGFHIEVLSAPIWGTVGTVATIFAAVATALAAWAAHRSAKAAEKSSNQWREQAIFDQILLSTASTRTSLPLYVNYALLICSHRSHDKIIGKSSLKTHDFLKFSSLETRDLNKLQQTRLIKFKEFVSEKKNFIETEKKNEIEKLYLTYYLARDFSQLKQDEKDKIRNVIHNFEISINDLINNVDLLWESKVNSKAIEHYFGTNDQASEMYFFFLMCQEIFELFFDYVTSPTSSENLMQAITKLETRFN